MEIILYTTGCPACAVLKKKLDSKKIIYTENNSETEMEALGITQVPVLSVNGNLLGLSDACKWVAEQEVKA